MFVARVTADVDALQQFMEWGGIAWIISLAQVIGALALMLAYSWQLALAVVLLVIPLLLVVVGRCRPGSRPRSTRRARASARCSPRSPSP